MQQNESLVSGTRCRHHRGVEQSWQCEFLEKTWSLQACARTTASDDCGHCHCRLSMIARWTIIATGARCGHRIRRDTPVRTRTRAARRLRKAQGMLASYSCIEDSPQGDCSREQTYRVRAAPVAWLPVLGQRVGPWHASTQTCCGVAQASCAAALRGRRVVAAATG